MRKRHQALFISSQTKDKICKELAINNSTYEIEQKQILNNYFKDNIAEEDVEVQINNREIEEKNQEKDEDDEDEDEKEDDQYEEENISLNSNITVPPLGDQKGPYIKFDISEKAFVGGVNFIDYNIIPENRIKIKEVNTEDKNKNMRKNDKINKDNETTKVGAALNFKNIIEQMAYWGEELNYEKSKDKTKNKKKLTNVEIPDINIMQLFKLYPNKIDEICEKIKNLEKEARERNLYTDNTVIKKLLNDQENIINGKKENINKLIKEFDRIQNITYGENFSVINFK